MTEELPADLSEALSDLEGLDDGMLWQSAQARLSSESAERLEELFFERQYERTMLVRAHAAMLLKRRGYDVDRLVNPG